MKRITVSLVCAFVAVSALNSLAVDGVAVGVHSTYTHAYGWHFGNIKRFIITNNVPDGGTVIYSASNGQRARCVSISPRGSRVAFIREDGKVCIKSIEPGGTVAVLASIPKDSWIDWPTENYVYYVNQWQGNELWRVNTSGTPSPSRVATGLQSAMQFSVDSSCTRGTAVTCCYSARSWTLSGSSITLATNNGGCGAGISPSGRYFTNNQGDHASVSIRNFDGSQLHFFRSSNCSNAGSNWNRNRWSANSDDWVSFTQGTPYQLDDGHHQVLYKKDGSQCIQVQPYQGGVYYEGDDFWVGRLGPVPPAINLSTSSLAFNADIGGGNPSNQVVSVSNGGDGTLPTLSVSEDAGWLNVSVSGSGNTQTLTNSVTIAGLAGNVYNATVTVSGSNVSSAQYTVRLTVVAPPVLSSIAVTPATAYVQPGNTQQFSASGRDQYNNAFSLGAVTWSVSGGGTISAAGLFTAGTAEGGPYVVTATSGTVSGTAQVSVAMAPPVHLKVNCGGSATDDWGSTAAYVSGGADFTFGGTHDIAGVTDPAPNTVYQTVRHQDHTYSFPASAVPNGSYTVRLHFTDSYDGDRRMDYTIEGVKVLDDFNITDAAGGTNKAIVREFEVSVADGNGMQIVCSKDQGNDVFEAAIEIIGGSSTTPQRPPVKVVAPNGSETYHIGDTLTVVWEWDTALTGGIAVFLSVDDGETFTIITPASVPSNDAGSVRGSFSWVIPPTLGGMSSVSGNCIVRVNEYTLMDLKDYSDAAFSIAASGVTGVSWNARRDDLFALNRTAGTLSLAVRAAGSHEVTVCRLDGTVLAHHRGTAPATHAVDGGYVPGAGGGWRQGDRAVVHGRVETLGAAARPPTTPRKGRRRVQGPLSKRQGTLLSLRKHGGSK